CGPVPPWWGNDHRTHRRRVTTTSTVAAADDGWRRPAGPRHTGAVRRLAGGPRVDAVHAHRPPVHPARAAQGDGGGAWFPGSHAARESRLRGPDRRGLLSAA